MEEKYAMIAGKNFEEIELVSVVDILRRAKINLEIVSLFNEPVITGSHKIKIIPDLNFSEFNSENYAGIILPGGPGADHLEDPLIEQDNLIELIKQFNSEKKLVSAICAAPQVLGKAKVLDGLNITHFPEADQFLDASKIDLSKTSIIDQNIVTGRSPGTAIWFALNLVEFIKGKAIRDEVESHLVI